MTAPLQCDSANLGVSYKPETISRRGALLLLSSALVGATIPLRAVRAQEPVTIALVAVKCIQVAVALAQMFQKAGPSELELQLLQAEMLRAISDELRVVNDGIQLALSKLDLLIQLVGKVPDEVVTKLYKTSIEAEQQHYLELTKTYVAIRAARGIEAARSAIERELRDNVIAELRRARLNLARGADLLSVPTMASAAFVETHAMILLNEPHERICAAIDAYSDYLTSRLYGPEEPYVVQELLSRTSEYANTRRAQDAGHTFECSQDRYELGQNYCPGPGTNAVAYSCVTATSFATFNPLASGPLLDVSKDLMERKLLPPGARPVEAKQSTKNRVALGDIHCNGNGLPPRMLGHQQAAPKCSAQGFANECSSYEPRLASANEKSWNDELQIAEARLLTMHSMKYAGDTCLQFLAKLKRSLCP